jgi:hypothetical protein
MSTGDRHDSGRDALRDDTSRSAASRRRRARADIARAAEMTTSCTIDSTDAERRSRNWVVRVQISVSMVPYRTPPSTRTTPKAVAQNRKTTDAADATAGASDGSVTVRNTLAGPAPRDAAACSVRGSSRSHSPPTVRTTTDTLKKTRATTIPASDSSSPRNPSTPAGANRVRNATPTTTVGSTNGTVTSPRARVRPGNDRRYSR